MDDIEFKIRYWDYGFWIAFACKLIATAWMMFDPWAAIPFLMGCLIEAGCIIASHRWRKRRRAIIEKQEQDERRQALLGRLSRTATP